MPTATPPSPNFAKRGLFVEILEPAQRRLWPTGSCEVGSLRSLTVRSSLFAYYTRLFRLSSGLPFHGDFLRLASFACAQELYADAPQ